MAFIGSLRGRDPLGADPRFARDFEEADTEVLEPTPKSRRTRKKASLPERDDSCLAIELQPAQREELEEIIGLAQAGLLPRSRELKPYEPDKLNARHVQIVMMKAAGMRHGLIAEILGIGEANVSVVANHPDAIAILNKVLSYAAEQATDLNARIKAHAPEMLDTIIEITRDKQGTKPETRSANAFKLLEMAGYGAVEKKETTHKIEVPAQQFDLLSKAIEESKDVTHLSRVVVKPVE